MKSLARKYRNARSLQLIALAVLLMAINAVSKYYFVRVDLTEDQRYTLSSVTRRTVQSLDDIVFIQVFLEGNDLPAGFRKLRQATRELLDNLRAYNPDNIQYEFKDPFAEELTDDQRQEVIRQLAAQGLEPINLEVKEQDRIIQKIIIPGAILRYQGREFPIMLLDQRIGRSSLEVIHLSIVNLEYKFADAFYKLQLRRKPRIAFITGHGELTGKPIADIQATLRRYYEVWDINLPRYKVGKLDNYDVVVIPRPTQRFSDLEKYKIDQFVMKGGRVLWLIDPLAASMDSLRTQSAFVTSDYPLNLRDLLFKYGVRINLVLVQDLNSHVVPILTNVMGRPQQDFMPWPYAPLSIPLSPHPIVKNLNPIWFRFVSNISLVNDTLTRKVPLLVSSRATRVLPHPVRVGLEEFRTGIDESMFQGGPQLFAVLLEGKFTSLFQHRIAPATIESGQYGTPMWEVDSNRMIVIADGDVIRNQVNHVTGQAYPLGYDRYTNQTFGNKELIINAIEYLLGHDDLLQLRTREQPIRLLDREKIKSNKMFWKAINVAGPFMLMLLPLIWVAWRRRKYSR